MQQPVFFIVFVHLRFDWSSYNYITLMRLENWRHHLFSNRAIIVDENEFEFSFWDVLEIQLKFGLYLDGKLA